jgi:hypothetical protein
MTIRLRPPLKLARKVMAAQASAAVQVACTLPSQVSAKDPGGLGLQLSNLVWLHHSFSGPEL